MSITPEAKASLIKQFARTEGDTGSPEVQVAILTHRINYLTGHFKEHKKDPTRPQTDPVVSIDYVRGISRAGNDMLTANIVTSRRKFSVYLLENNNYAAAKKAAFAAGTGEFARTPRTITYVKDGDFWKVLGFDRPSDEEELQRRLCEV